MKLTSVFKGFFSSERAAGFILIFCTAISLLIANSSIGPGYQDLWHTRIGFMSVEQWINDGLMAIFFLMVGLEIEREIYIGELSQFRQAMLPVIAAVGGMIIPAAIHFALNAGTDTQRGFGIPMATDIAFALGVLSLAGKRVPVALKIFLTALAIIDDLGAILVIALFYTNELSMINLGIAFGIFALLFIMGRMRVHNLMFYILPGIVMWYFMMKSGVHPTISGVLLAFAIPFGKNEAALSNRLQQALHIPVAYVILPLFALSNTGIRLEPGFYTSLMQPNSRGILFGLVIGKPLGILGFSWLSIKMKIAELPSLTNYKHLLAAGMLGGIGFTMSIFITILAFPGALTVTHSKIAILTASIISALLGLLLFRTIKPTNHDQTDTLVREEI